MSREMNVSGKWVGHYLQHERSHPIVADLVQAGEHLTGSMRDGETDMEQSVTEVAQQAKLPPGGDEQIVDRLRKMFPDAPATPVRYVTHLPPESALQGWVKGPEVYFLKAYLGTHYGGYQIGDKLVGYQHTGHTVHYHGRVSPEGDEIEGKWSIEGAPARGTARTEGSFTLRRHSAD
jgi:hypothetical protein